MLNIYCGRESRNREAFLFDRIGQRLQEIRSKESVAKRVLLIVPAQYTLKAEEAAFFHLKEEGFFDLQIMSGNRLRRQILHETGKPDRIAINTLGRTLLLRSVVLQSRSALDAFQKAADSPDFLSMAGAMIAQLKQSALAPEDLESILQRTESQGILHRKLSDMHRIYRDYQAALEGKWIDSEDLLPAVSRKVSQSEFIRSSEIWFHDFYSFTVRETEFMAELMIQAPELSVVLTGCEPGDPDEALFAPTRRAASALQAKARGLEVPCRQEWIPGSFERLGRPERLRSMEKLLYVVPAGPAPARAPDPSLTLLRAGNPYTESQTIATEILRLCKEEGYMPEEIAVLTNDTAGRGTILRRMFKLYGIPCFLDEKRTVLHSPLIRTLSSLLNAAADGRLAGDVLGFLKTGLVKLFEESEQERFADIEEFENYVLQYHIRGERFSKPFVYGVSVFGDDGLRRLEDTRARLDGLLTPFLRSLEAASTIREKSALLFRFLSEDLHMEGILESHALRLDEIGMSDAAQETRQMWNLFTDLLDQVVELIGDRETDTPGYRDVLTASFADLKVGLLPQAAHSVLIGTVGRSRLSGIKALFVAGVNDGILPSNSAGEGILTDRELQLLEELGCSLSKNQETLRQEEDLVIYQAFTRPSEKLFISYATADTEGSEIRPSPLVTQLRTIFPDLPLQPDAVHPDREADLYRAPIPAALHLTSALQRYLSGEDKVLSPVVQKVYDFFLAHAPDTAAVIRNGLFFSNAAEPLSEAAVKALYKYDAGEDLFAFSPTRLEKFAQCPFMHYVAYGLQPRPRESFEITGREIGDVYHECLMRLTRDLLQETDDLGVSVTDPVSPWMRITREECDARVTAILDKIRQEIFEGLLKAGKAEEYQAERIALVARTFLWQVITQVRKGHITRIFPEAGFGRSRAIPPLKLSLGKETVLIEGKIDRIDLMQTGENGTYIKVIDYKSGQVDFSKDLILRGLHLQLMVYLESALALEQDAEPAGIFYCHIEDPQVPISPEDLAAGHLPQEILQTLEARYRMEGLFIGEPPIVETMDATLREGEKSTVIPVTKKKTGYDSNRAVSKEEFDVFRKDFRKELQDVCRRLTEGLTDIRPQKLSRDRTACTYCDYRSICLYDKDFIQSPAEGNSRR